MREFITKGELKDQKNKILDEKNSNKNEIPLDLEKMKE